MRRRDIPAGAVFGFGALAGSCGQRETRARNRAAPAVLSGSPNCSRWATRTCAH